MKRAIDDWFGELTESGSLLEGLRFESWKQARTVSLDSGTASDAAGPLLVGRPQDADSVLVACLVLEAKTIKAAVRIASSWPVREAVVEARPLDGSGRVEVIVLIGGSPAAQLGAALMKHGRYTAA